MHDYGIKASALVGLDVYEQACRGSGRTYLMVSALKGGETVLAWKSGAPIERMIRDQHGPEIKVRVHSVASDEEIILAVREAIGRRSTVVLDHFVISNLYRRALERAASIVQDLGIEPEPSSVASGRPPPVGEFLTRGRYR